MSDIRSAEAKARDEWFSTAGGMTCATGKATGQYLRNRLETAFIAGVEAGKRIASERIAAHIVEVGTE